MSEIMCNEGWSVPHKGAGFHLAPTPIQLAPGVSVDFQ